MVGRLGLREGASAQVPYHEARDQHGSALVLPAAKLATARAALVPGMWLLAGAAACVDYSSLRGLNADTLAKEVASSRMRVPIWPS
ncbi:hypothetical protein Poly30_41770 [Planctomycetes bacterium Poly30]|uniref:Uncharacterized protein n=1 Tax=Saltatorellus ferox TaxID=2528018 RepID=A0A518EWZ9_9BACT|nr:hypothetical protein Poly30_41770 [Planctomycetes bacterium Poly30]